MGYTKVESIATIRGYLVVSFECSFIIDHSYETGSY